MTKILVAEQWEMALPDPDPDNPWYLDWTLKSMPSISRSVTTGWHAYRSLVGLQLPIYSAREYFGGIGAQTLIIRDMFTTIADHTVMDYAPGSAAHLRKVLPDSVHVRQGDAYDRSTTFPADLVALDFGDMTVKKTDAGQPHRALMDRVFHLNPRAVVVTDVAASRLHLHRKLYEGLLGDGACESYETYLRALMVRFQVLYGYVVVAGFYHRGAAKLALVPDDVLDMPGPISPTPESPVGLKLVR